MDGMVVIDGSLGEGGGQVLRSAVTLSAITGRPVRIENIRARRSNPGLQAQHLTSVRAAAAVTAAELSGASPGSQTLQFVPAAPPAPGDYFFEVGTAGSVVLVAQTVLPLLAGADAPSCIRITGGTHVPHAPPVEYLAATFSPAMALLGRHFNVELETAGFFPKGGGRVTLRIPGLPQQPGVLCLEDPGPVLSLEAWVVTGRLEDHVAERGARALVEGIAAVVGPDTPFEPVIRRLPARSPGAAAVLAVRRRAGFAGFTSLGEIGLPMEQVAARAVWQFADWLESGCAVDSHLADQLVIPAALSGGGCWTFPEVDGHLPTVLEVARRFLPVEWSLDAGERGYRLELRTRPRQGLLRGGRRGGERQQSCWDARSEARHERDG